jgi:peptide methionine sulfoxide reductase MsrA
VWYQNEEQKEAVAEKIKELKKGGPVTTHVAPLGEFYKAEAYHQKCEKLKNKSLRIDVFCVAEKKPTYIIIIVFQVFNETAITQEHKLMLPFT